ncbi:hypothetical protein STCU_03062 [Strigomonas culicis]|uniref:Exocyst subunit Exo70 family protein n=1 Tax=Strigomonas culicis TaxID=28005 RepID=S9VY17_9TRYP|nr:hypothetical protein STCU_03062 [Strigomonas culicis]|eukprot:EPY31961.1 hypothetical protein STCU_03062 [Strigomonas culicis]
MSKAARCYHPPPSLTAVLGRKDTSPEAIARCVDYLVYTEDYLASHPPNPFSDEIQSKTEAYLRQIVEISEDIVKTSFLNAFQKGKTSASKAYIIKNPDVLKGLELVVQRLGENFNRLDVMKNDVYNMIQSRLSQFVDAHFDATYREEEMGKTNVSAHASMTPVMKHYQKGNHRLLGISATSREAVKEVCTCIGDAILTPLDDDYSVAEMPGELATSVFDTIFARCMALVRFDMSHFDDPTKMFVLSRGLGVGLCPGVRYFRDVIFVGLNLVEELWNWKQLAASLPGENSNCVDHVDNEIERFTNHLRELLEGYARCKGGLRKDSLVEYARSLRRFEWFPSLDCTAHESSTNSLYFHKVLVGSYYGALKIVLYGNVMDPSGDVEATREVEDYLIRCVMGNVQDLVTIAEAAIVVQTAVEAGGRHHIGRSSIQAISGSGEGSHLSLEIFLINNIIFLLENYKRENCFTQRLIVDDSSDVKVKPQKGAAKVANAKSIISEAMLYLAEEKERYVKEYGLSWEGCFPNPMENESLASIPCDESIPLRKSQRAAVKRWHADVTASLTGKIRDCKAQAVMDSNVRLRLIEAAVFFCQEQFKDMESVLLGRTWSSRPQRYMPYSMEEWIDQLKQSF